MQPSTADLPAGTRRHAHVDADASFVRFVYPIVFDPETFGARCRAAEAASWPSPKGAIPIWEPRKFPEQDLLPHVARYLNAPVDRPATARLWQLTERARTSSSGLGARGGAWSLSGRVDVAFEVAVVELALFRVGVGFLTVETRLPTADLHQWLDLVHHFRFAAGQRRGRVEARRRRGPQLDEPFFPPAAGGLQANPGGSGPFMRIVEALLGSASDTSDAWWWREPYVPGQLLPFTALFVDDVEQEEMPQLLYRVRNFFSADQNIHPGPDDLRLDEPPGAFSYARDQWFTFSLDGGGFLACNAPTSRFWRDTLPTHLRNEYFLLFMLALQQRFALMMLYEAVAEHWIVDDAGDPSRRRDSEFEAIRDTLLSFAARGYFAQVMQREHHHRSYRRWQQVFQVERIHQEVSDAIREMHSQLLIERTARLQQVEEAQQARTRRLEGRLNQIALLLGVPAVALTFLGTLGPANLWTAAAATLGSLLVGAVALVLIGRASSGP